MSIQSKLLTIQSNLKVNKNQYNSFGKYNYRSCEDILEGVKPLLTETQSTLVINDEPILLGDRVYIKSTATLTDSETGEKESATAYAREDVTKKGMDLAQVTGSTSSYARKYALNGLFCIDDTKDADTKDNSNNSYNNDKNITLQQAQEHEFKTKAGAVKGKDMETKNLEWYSTANSKSAPYAKVLLANK